MEFADFKDVVLNYKAVFLDSFGVLKTHSGILEGINDTFEYLKEQGIKYYVLTNDASRSPEQLAHYFHTRGVKHITADRVVSSGMLAQEYLLYKIKEGVVAYLGTPNSAHYIEKAGLQTVSINELNLDDRKDISALVFLDDEGFDWNHDINKVINLLRLRNIPVIVANTDTAYPVSKHEIAVAIGGIADMVEEIVGKHFIRFGKPDAQMFTFAYEMLTEQYPISKEEILMVGDTLHTDIIGGNKFGIDTALTLTGNTLPEHVALLIETTGIIPTYICPSALVS